MRKLSSEELTNGMFVQCKEPDLDLLSPVIYQILIRDGRYFYKEMNSDWEMEGDIVKSVWWETAETKSLNREQRLIEIGI